MGKLVTLKKQVVVGDVLAAAMSRVHEGSVRVSGGRVSDAAVEEAVSIAIASS